jgi:hypothetical protein
MMLLSTLASAEMTGFEKAFSFPWIIGLAVVLIWMGSMERRELRALAPPTLEPPAGSDLKAKWLPNTGSEK